MKTPAFQFYPADFLIGTMGMTDEEIGIYIKMLALQWEHGSLPNDRKTIKKLINSRKIPSDIVIRKFEISDDGSLRNQRLEKERSKQATFRESRANNAKKRWEKEKPDDAPASTVHQRSTSETNALSSSTIQPAPQAATERKPTAKTAKTPTTPQALRIAKLFHRKTTTVWSAKEIKAYKAICPIDPLDLDLVCRYTEAERLKGDNGRHRRDILTFLNNFTGELDRAKAQPTPSKPAPRQIQFID